jgi:hypothetical protein
MRATPAKLIAIILSSVALAACPADRQAAEPVDASPDPRIEQAPAYPTPPGEVPTGLQPEGAPGATGQQPGTPRDTVADRVGDPTMPGAVPPTRP